MTECPPGVDPDSEIRIRLPASHHFGDGACEQVRLSLGKTHDTTSLLSAIVPQNPNGKQVWLSVLCANPNHDSVIVERQDFAALAEFMEQSAAKVRRLIELTKET